MLVRFWSSRTAAGRGEAPSTAAAKPAICASVFSGERPSAGAGDVRVWLCGQWAANGEWEGGSRDKGGRWEKTGYKWGGREGGGRDMIPVGRKGWRGEEDRIPVRRAARAVGQHAAVVGGRRLGAAAVELRGVGGEGRVWRGGA